MKTRASLAAMDLDVPNFKAASWWEEMNSISENWWARQDLNLGPTDYESAALTAELRARIALIILQRKELEGMRNSVPVWVAASSSTAAVIWSCGGLVARAELVRG
jgi:hypothetical protein